MPTRPHGHRNKGEIRLLALHRVDNFAILKTGNLTRNMAEVAERRRAARESRGSSLREIEGDQTYEQQQEFLQTAALIAKEGRLSRFLYVLPEIGLSAGPGAANRRISMPHSIHSFANPFLTLFHGGILSAFPPHRSGSVRSAKTTGDNNMPAVWLRAAFERTRLQFL